MAKVIKMSSEESPLDPNDMKFVYIDGIGVGSTERDVQKRFDRPGWLRAQEMITDRDKLHEMDTDIRIQHKLQLLATDYWIRTGKDLLNNYFERQRRLNIAMMRVIRRN